MLGKGSSREANDEYLSQDDDIHYLAATTFGMGRPPIGNRISSGLLNMDSICSFLESRVRGKVTFQRIPRSQGSGHLPNGFLVFDKVVFT